MSDAARLESLDVFRGLTIAGMILVSTPGTWTAVYTPLDHAAWNGWTPTDLIFPFLLFAMGAAVPYALARRRGAPRRVRVHIVRRVRRRLAEGRARRASRAVAVGSRRRRHAGRPCVGTAAADQQESVDEFVRGLQRRARSAGSRRLPLADRHRRLARVVASVRGLRSQSARGVLSVRRPRQRADTMDRRRRRIAEGISLPRRVRVVAPTVLHR